VIASRAQAERLALPKPEPDTGNVASKPRRRWWWRRSG
jgi:hypothetical protein